MPQELCHTCKNPLPAGQSFYEDHGVKVCLTCFRTVPKCQRCRFPSKSLKRVEGYGNVCEFCEDSFADESGMVCYLCQKKIWPGVSYYEDHGQKVCQNCFKDAKIRCFTCRFPRIQETVFGLGGICQFCQKGNLSKKTDLNPLLQPLIPFIKRYNHKLISPLNIQWFDWKLILGMQVGERQYEIKFFNELIRYCYPVYFLKERMYVIPSIPQQWFMPYMAGQLVAADLCKKYSLSHLQGDSPFHQLARGWCHWVAYMTARVLKYKKIAKFLSRFPESDLVGTFPKFLAMTEYRNPKEVIDFAQKNLKDYGRKYL